MPYSTKLLRTHIIHAGSLSSYKVLMPDNSYNIIEIGDEKISLKLRFVDLGEMEIGTFTLKPEPPDSIMKYHRLTSTRKILFISQRNSCRTKIAEAIFNKIAPHNMHAVSAGIGPCRDVDAIALSVGKSLGLKLSKPRKLVRDMVEDADYVVSFDESIEGTNPDEVWDIKAPTTEEEYLGMVREIERRVNELVRKQFMT